MLQHTQTLPSPTPFEDAKRFFLDGIGYFESGCFSEALTAFEASLVLLTGRVSTLANLGATLVKLGQADAALQVLDQALAVDTGYSDAWSHRGLALADLGRHAEALACHDRVLAQNQTSVPAWYQRSLMLNVLGRHEEALKATESLLVVDPDSFNGWRIRGEVLHRLNRQAEALAAFDRVLAIDPSSHQVWSQRAGILKDLGHHDDAIAAFKQALALGGDRELNGYFLASLSGIQTPATAPRQYVEALFNDYADEFDAHLVGVLGYRAHKVLIEQAQGLGKPHYRCALDLGCGTGLCGPLIKPNADQIHGVDLSSLMLDKARVLGVYASLVQADLSVYLQETHQRYDWVVSADVFIYVGALEAVFAGVHRLLDPGGLFCFSVELADDAFDYRLRKSQRYAHSERYLRALATSTGFSIVQMLQHPIREEQLKAIDGLFVYLTRN